MPNTEVSKNIISVCEQFDIPITLADPDQPDAPLLFASRKFLKLTGYSAEEVLGQNCRFLQGPESDPAIAGRLSNACARRAKHSCCVINYRKDGGRFNNLLTIEPIEVSTTKTLLVGFQHAFDDTVSRKQVRFQMEYINVLLRSIYRKTHTRQKLLADADVLRGESIASRADSAFFLVSNHLAQERTMNAIQRSHQLLETTRALSRNTLRRSA